MQPFDNTGTASVPVIEEAQVYDYPGIAAPAPRTAPHSLFYRMIKRTMDIVFSALALLFLSPLLLVVAIAIRLDSPGPAIYAQTRIGKQKKPFTMYKFRSMCNDAEARLRELESLNERDGPVFKISNDPRVTRVGAFIRKTCIDELPQLWNIFKGDMTLVGPRPPLPREVERYIGYHYRRLDVTPGLTCYWQISNREMTFDQWVSLDLQYIQEAGLWVDLSILFKTALVVFRTKGDT